MSKIGVLKFFTSLLLASLIAGCDAPESSPQITNDNEVFTSEEFILPPIPDTIFFCNEVVLINVLTVLKLSKFPRQMSSSFKTMYIYM